MAYGAYISGDVIRLARTLKEDHELTDYEALSLALQGERNEILKAAFVLSSTDEYPSGLEAISIALGYEKK